MSRTGTRSARRLIIVCAAVASAALACAPMKYSPPIEPLSSTKKGLPEPLDSGMLQEKSSISSSTIDISCGHYGVSLDGECRINNDGPFGADEKIARGAVSQTAIHETVAWAGGGRPWAHYDALNTVKCEAPLQQSATLSVREFYLSSAVVAGCGYGTDGCGARVSPRFDITVRLPGPGTYTLDLATKVEAKLDGKAGPFGPCNVFLPGKSVQLANGSSVYRTSVTRAAGVNLSIPVTVDCRGWGVPGTKLVGVGCIGEPNTGRASARGAATVKMRLTVTAP